MKNMTNKHYLIMLVAVLFGIIIAGCDNPHFTSGKEQMELKNYKSAREELLQVVNEKPDHDEANFLIAKSYFHEGDNLKALEYVHKMSEDSRTDEEVENLLTDIQLKGIKLLDSSDSADQLIGIKIIEKLPSKEAVPNLKKALHVQNRTIALKSEALLKKIEPSVLRSEWIKMLQSDNLLIKEKAAEELWNSERYQGASSILRDKYSKLFLEGDETAGKKLLELGKKESAPLLIWTMRQKDKKIALQAVALARNLSADELDINNNSEGKIAILFASEYGHTEVVKLLAEAGADLNIQDTNGTTALMKASAQKASDIVKILLDHGADANIQDNKKRTAFTWAFYANDAVSAKLLIQHGIKINKEEATNLAILAAREGKWDIVKLLLEQGINIAEATNLAILVAGEGKWDVVKLLLEQGININDKDSQGKTVLMHASEQGNLEIVKLLLKHKAATNVATLGGHYTALMLALQNEHPDIAKYLINNNADVEIAASDGMTPLMAAASKGYLEITQLLLERDADVNKATKKSGDTALMFASSQGHVGIVQLLIDRGANLEADDKRIFYKGGTALAQAINAGHKDVVKLLIVNGAAIPSKILGRSALHLAIEKGSSDIVEILLEHGVQIDDSKKEPDILFALDKRQLKIAEILIKNGADVHAKGHNGITALIKASEQGGQEVVNLLLDRKADVNAQTKRNKQTALLLALQGKHFEIAKQLIQRGADVNTKDYYGTTPIIEAVKQIKNKNDIEVIHLLIEKGAKISAKTRNGQTALIEAVSLQKNGPDVVKVLFEHNAEMNQDAFFKAIKANEADIVRIFLEKGADAKSLSDSGLTALMEAAQGGNLDVVKLLVEYGADVNRQDSKGDTALMKAAYNRQALVIKWLAENGADRSLKNKQGKTVRECTNDEEVNSLLKWIDNKGKNISDDLIVGIKYRDIELIKQSLNSGIDVNAIFPGKNYTPLMLASYYGYTDIVKFLIQNGANAKKIIANVSPLSIAEERGNTEVIQILESAGAKSNLKLWEAVMKNDYQTVLYELKDGANPNAISPYNENTPLTNWMTPLMCASFLGSADIAKVLIEYGADVNAKWNGIYRWKGANALFFAIDKGQLEIVKLLIENGVDVHARPTDGMYKNASALMVAEAMGLSRIARLIRKAEAKTQEKMIQLTKTFSESVKTGDIDTINDAFYKGVDINASVGGKFKGLTPLMVAAINGHQNIVDWLIEHGGNVNAKTIDEEFLGVTALMFASAIGHTNIVKTLIRNGAEVNAKVQSGNLKGKSALSMAITEDHKTTVRLLLQSGAESDSLPADYDTVYDQTANSDIKNAYTVAQAYFIDFPDGTVTIPELRKQGYRSYNKPFKGVTLSIENGKKETLKMSSFHEKGKKIFSVDSRGKIVTKYKNENNTDSHVNERDKNHKEIMRLLLKAGLESDALPSVAAIYDKTARTDIMNAYTSAQIYFIDHPNSNVTIEALKQVGYNLHQGVNLTIENGRRKTLKMTTHHERGKKVYSVNWGGDINVKTAK